MKRADQLLEVAQDPVFRALHPERGNFLEIRWLPERLNPFAKEGIQVAALVFSSAFPHSKVVPTFEMMFEDCREDRYANAHTLVVDSSGNTAHAAVLLARTFGFSTVKVVMSSDVPDSKKSILTSFGSSREFSVDVISTGNPAVFARTEGKKRGHYHLNQYAHRGNPRGHALYTGPKIDFLFESFDLGVVSIALGSGGTACGVGEYFKRLSRRKTRPAIVGVRPKLGEQVPGTRDKWKMEEVVTLPWQGAVDVVVEAGRKESFVAMRRLWSAVVPQPGPSSGLAWLGLEHYLKSRAPQEREGLRGTVAAFLCPDDGRFYSAVTMAELDPDQ